MSENLDQIRVVLVNTSHPGNIGSSARAMKNMGLSQLVLVDPVDYPSSKATAMSAGADDVLANARVVGSLSEAVADCELVIGTSARHRYLDWPLVSPREMTDVVLPVAASKQKIALVFGREASGLTNQELECCQYHVHIPTNPEYSSLNLSQAVQVLCYELRQAETAGNLNQPEREAVLYPNAHELELFQERLEWLLLTTEFIGKRASDALLRRFHRLFQRARIEKEEYTLLMGVMRRLEVLLERKSLSQGD